MIKFIRYLWVKYWKLRGSPIQPWLRWRLDRQTREEILRNGWHDQ